MPEGVIDRTAKLFGPAGKRPCAPRRDWRKRHRRLRCARLEGVGGIAAVKLQLIPRDPALAKTAPKVLLWIDMDKGVAVKQQRFDQSGGYVIFTYANLKLNGSVPSGAFEIKTAPGTQIVNH